MLDTGLDYFILYFDKPKPHTKTHFINIHEFAKFLRGGVNTHPEKFEGGYRILGCVPGAFWPQ